MISRRSFLAAIAAAVALKPEQLTGPPIPRFGELLASPEASNRLVYRPWHITDSVQVEPGASTGEALFDGPSPSNFAIRGIGWRVPSETPARDVSAILDALEARLVINDKTYVAAPLHTFGQFGGGLQVLVPQIFLAPAGTLRLDVAGFPCDLSEAVRLMFYIEGVIARQL